MIHKPPKPETTRAVLVSAGLPRPTATVHHYYATRLVRFPGIPGLTPDTQAWEYVFRCFRTGAERRWGLARGPGDADEGPPPPTRGGDDDADPTPDRGDVN